MSPVSATQEPAASPHDESAGARLAQEISLLHENARMALELLLKRLEERDRTEGGQLLCRTDDVTLYRVLMVEVMCQVAELWAEQRALPVSALRTSRLFQGFQLDTPLSSELSGGRLARYLGEDTEQRVRELLGVVRHSGKARSVSYAALAVEELGRIFESLLARGISRNIDGFRAIARGSRRKQAGTFYTPNRLTETIVARAVEPFFRAVRALPPSEQASAILAFKACDPAMGAGAFLIELCRQLSAELTRARSLTEQRKAQAEAYAQVVEHCLHGVDLDPIATAVAAVSLWLLVGDPKLPLSVCEAKLRTGDALFGRGFEANDAGDDTRDEGEATTFARAEPRFDWTRHFPQIAAKGGFDLMIGNPPWVSFAGRSAQPLEPQRRRYYTQAFQAFSGFPTLHGLFIERCAQLARNGSLALLVPSPVADLSGYKGVRRAVTQRHQVREPLLELGQDAFAEVTQPAFALIADACETSTVCDQAWRLEERARLAAVATELRVPEVLLAFRDAATLPAEAFGERGFQSSRVASETLFLRAVNASEMHSCPLLEGRDVAEFRQRAPRLFLREDAEALRSAKCRLRPRSHYVAVQFVIRQTAAFPIAALHGGMPFRNSLLAGFAVSGLSAPLLVALLNSSLYRALHLAMQRDARQAAFPQVKLSHLRALPLPPSDAERFSALEALTHEATAQGGLSRPLRKALDQQVFELFGVPDDHARSVLGFLERRGLSDSEASAADGVVTSPLDGLRARLVR